MPILVTMRYCASFPKNIPLYKVGCIRVTHPCAGRQQKQASLLPLDLHVLGLPLAFILSQDQTLRCKSFKNKILRLYSLIYLYSKIELTRTYIVLNIVLRICMIDLHHQSPFLKSYVRTFTL